MNFLLALQHGESSYMNFLLALQHGEKRSRPADETVSRNLSALGVRVRTRGSGQDSGQDSGFGSGLGVRVSPRGSGQDSGQDSGFGSGLGVGVRTRGSGQDSGFGSGLGVRVRTRGWGQDSGFGSGLGVRVRTRGSGQDSGFGSGLGVRIIMPRSCFLFLLLLRFNPSLTYSLKNCTVEYSADVSHVSVLCMDRELTAVPDDIPKTAQSLILSTNQILSINQTDLRGLSKLVFFLMQLNSLSHVADGAFADLVELTELDLSCNDLTDLTDDMFQGLTKLLSLSLNRNQIAYISPLAFQPLINLQKVDLADNELRVITYIVPILQLSSLNELHIGTNRFTTFESDDLHLNISNLRRLEFNLNPLEKFSITKDVFPHLEYVDLSKCSVGFEWNVPDKTFLRSLTSLLLSGTEISFETYSSMLRSAESVEYLWLSYTTEWFDKGLIDVACQIPALTNLDLTCNDIHILNDTLLQPCSKITQLALVGNVMTHLSEDSLRPLTQLVELRLHQNFLPEVPFAVRGLSSLAVLTLSYNDIGELGCSDFLNLTSLMQIFLNNNRISRLRGCVFQELKNLRLLYIEDNPIYSLDDTFKVSLKSLRILNMHSNDLKGLSKGVFENLSFLLNLDLKSRSICHEENGTFEGLDHLQTLVLTAYSLTTDMFRGLPHLENLTITLPIFLNSLSHQLPKEPPFLNVPSLRELAIQNMNKYNMVITPDLLRGLNSLENFAAVNFFAGPPHPDTFTYTPHLISLQITDSNVSYPEPEMVRPIPNLQSLDLSKNKLRSLDFLAQADLPVLSWLKLSENELTVINETVFQSLPALTYLDLLGNPFTCSCSNVGFIQWMISNNQTQVVNAYQYTCSFPPSKQGSKLLDFDIQSCWMDVNFLCFISSTCLVVLTLLTSFIYHFLRWQLTYGFYLFLAFLYDKRKRKQEAPHCYDAFISYNVHDEAWVYQEMLPVLEGEQGWRLCLHHRDFQPDSFTSLFDDQQCLQVLMLSAVKCDRSHRHLQVQRDKLCPDSWLDDFKVLKTLPIKTSEAPTPSTQIT
ncbi:toll-like receptor 13 [Scomber japonicus]|uniref:toll-like receptor 13 n=1 Tax=Scomber japonicus TaxID=13676 RepID=UPI002306D4A5|nr:toll-like receptor 13 [Scomber japonicus]